VSVVFGSLAGIALARRGGSWTRPFLVILFLILVTPEIVDGIAYLIWFVRIGVDSNLVRLVIGHTVFNSAVVTLIVRARLAGLDESLEEAAADLGATPTRVFRQITLPLMLPAVLAGLLLSFTFSLDDVIVSSFVTTAGSFTLPVYVFSSLRTGLKTELAAVSTLMLCLTLFALVVTALVLRRSGDSTEEIAQTITGA
jgi:ABC-type spermidine/putrescine transport system permease subunit II